MGCPVMFAMRTGCGAFSGYNDRGQPLVTTFASTENAV
nr:hypothetical protein JVH1_8018 [Rhodococcus sp. JVH1]